MNRVRPLDEWVSRLSTSNPNDVAAALEVLGEALCADDEAVRERAAQLLVKELARAGSAAQGPILRLLQTSWWPPQVQLAEPALEAVLTAVARIDVDAPELDEAALLIANLYRAAPLPLSALEGALGHAKASVRRVAAGCVGRVGKAAVSLLPRLLTVLDDSESVAGAALESLGSLASAAPEVALPALFDQVSRAEGTRQYLALTSLRSLVEEGRREGKPAPELASLEPVLLKTAEDPQPPVRLEAVSLLGLGRLSSLSTVAALRKRLQDESPAVAACAAVALLRVGAPPQEAASLLAAQLASAENPDKVGAALSALEGVEPATLGRIRDTLAAAARGAKGLVAEALHELLPRNA
ncbi:HEAT repeat domain-containing protein [Myxococcus llanfairpwllgwyngyllgogerychwyrndrobwllllantysiliogogogochensis]|uniref:HEAT repeat domain-containing protein n=1 Tax=Myxococcus llanfairpwllgwyngyllgogerychwyrndrobwllllantysiliogogogochensis TaxID=2590453 RepID=UPI0015F09809|nr:HEAT repeat domain-containing protein [Myxococcus llanfairpwllgwyngyllgogerychwyrndrobwllllantysiliogogogochensis]